MSLEQLAHACASAEGDYNPLDSPALSASDKAPITRARQQLSCAACHARKQKCDRNIPCERCVLRGVADQCHIAAKGTNKVHRKPGSEPTPGPTTKRRKIAPEGGAQSSGDETFSGPGQLMQGRNGETTTYNFLGPSSVVDFIGRSMATQNLVQTLSRNMICQTVNAKPEVTAQTISSIVAQLPNRVITDRLIDEFYKLDFLMWLFAVAHRPSFDVDYLAMWYYAPASPFTMGGGVPSEPPKALTISFVANVCMMLAISLQFLPNELSYLTGGNTTATKDQLYLLARHALIQSELQESPDRCRAETILMFGIYAKNEGNAGEIFNHIASAIRVAQSIGMHRKSSPGWNIAPLEDELRKRAWAALYAYDRFCSIGYGRPYVVNDNHCDQGNPSNIDDIDLTVDGPRNIKPANVVTDTTYLLLQVKYAKLLGHVFEECFSIKQPTYATVLELDSEMHNFEISLPLQFRAPSTEDMHRKPKIAMQYGLMTAQICKSREALHRPFLLRETRPGEPDRYARSRVAAVNLARRTLHALREVQFHLHPKFFFLPHVCFDAGASLCVAASLEKKKNTPESLKELRLIDETVKEAIQLLSGLAPANHIAKESASALEQLRERLYAPKEPAFPPTTTSNGMISPPFSIATPRSQSSMSSLSNPLSNDILSQLTGATYPVTTSPADFSTPASIPDFSWQNPLPAVTLGNSTPVDNLLEPNPLMGTDDFLNAPTDLNFPNLFEFIGPDQSTFQQVMDSLLQ